MEVTCLPDVVTQSIESETSFSSPAKDTPSKDLVRLTIRENTPSWELKKWTVLPPPPPFLFLFDPWEDFYSVWSLVTSMLGRSFDIHSHDGYTEGDKSIIIL